METKQLNIKLGGTLFVDGIPILKVVAIGNRPYKALITVSPDIKTKVGIGDIQKSVVGDPHKEYLISAGDIVEVPSLHISTMMCQIRHGNASGPNQVVTRTRSKLAHKFYVKY